MYFLKCDNILSLKIIRREFTEVASRKQSEALNRCEKAVKVKDASVD